MQNIKEQEELKQFQITKYQMSHIIQPPFRNAEVIKYLRNVQENLREYSRPRLPLKKSKKHLNFYEKTQVPSREKILKIFRNTIYPSVSPKIMVKKVKKNIKLVLKPLIDPDFNYNSMRKKLEQKITNTNIEEGLSNFRNIQEYREIQVFQRFTLFLNIIIISLKMFQKKLKSSISGLDKMF